MEPLKAAWVPAESETRMENAELPATNGTPEIVPPMESVNPAGSVPLTATHV